MLLTHHPFQRAGAWAAAELCDRAHPADVQDADLDHLVELIALHAETAGTAERGGSGWAWQQKLAPIYPNAAPTHPRRHVSLRGPIRQQVTDLFTCDARHETTPCFTCGRPATARWGRSLWPLLDAAQHVNNTPDGRPGFPVCRECRIAVWCLPYAANLTAAQLYTLDAAPEGIEEETYRAQTRISATALREGWPDWTQAPIAPDLITDANARAPQPGPLTVLEWTNSNRSPQLVEYALDYAGVAWLRAIHGTSHEAWLREVAPSWDDRPLWLARMHPDDLRDHLIFRMLRADRGADQRPMLEAVTAARWAAEEGQDLAAAVKVSPTPVR